jgi:hypothetical protein
MSRTSTHLERDELEKLTGYEQPKRMCAWLALRGWVFEAPARRGDIPKVSRAYHDARMSGQPLAQQTRRVGPRLDFFADA